MPIRSVAAESPGDKSINQHSGVHRGVGMIGKLVRGAEHCKRSVAEKLVDVSTRLDDGGHHDVEQRVEPRHRVLSSIRLRERREVADVDEHHRHLATLTGEHVVALLQ